MRDAVTVVAGGAAAAWSITGWLSAGDRVAMVAADVPVVGVRSSSTT